MSGIRKIVLINGVCQLGAGKRATGDGWMRRMDTLVQYLTNAGISVGEVITVTEPTPGPTDSVEVNYKPEVWAVGKQIYEIVYSCLVSGRMPVLVGGDHSLAMGSITAASHYQQLQNASLGVLWSDAHIDMNTRETSPSGNIHGMAMAGLLGMDAEIWPPGNINPASLTGEDILALGLRFADRTEMPNVLMSGVKYRTMREINRVGFSKILAESVKAFIARPDALHLSFDLDGLDPSEAPGVNTPFPGGFTFREAHQLCELAHDSGKLISMDVVEHVPSDEPDKVMLPLMAELIAASLGHSQMPL